ncbi:hydrolase [uncultured Thiodictyon sp.]|uniref:hydrolase n=1 Tax=uncultured Thiodictyon sp. TaxID=1846217 RepID=UPI0025F22BBA|nr:hydrolase [uncultured Thiodictyon sp.]
MGEIVKSHFRPAWWLPGPHLQTIWPSLMRRRPELALTRRRIELADGDFIDLAVGAGDGPQVLVIHGLEGDLQSHYAGTLLDALGRAGYCAIFMHLRGASGEPNRLARSYHSGASEDLHEVLTQLAGDPAGAPLAAIGFSLGANLLLKYLGERGGHPVGDPQGPLLGAGIAVSAPFVLRDAMLRLDRGASRLYRRYLVDRLKLAFRRKFAARPCPLTIDLKSIHDFNQFDDQVTAPLCGFAGVFDYYTQASCRGYLPAITTPTLIVHALDDPFMFPATVPFEHELGPGVTLELSQHGGHVGFVGGSRPGRPEYWLEGRILDFLRVL